MFEEFQNITLKTPRLKLRGIPPQQLERLYNTKNEVEFSTLFGIDQDDYSYYRQMVNKGIESYRFSQFLFLIINNESGQTIGECGFHSINNKHFKGELFYLLRHDDFKQKGFMTEALPIVLDFGFNKLKLHRIEALVAPWNEPSIKLLNRFGFIKEGTRRQDYLLDGKFEDSDSYSLLKPEWEKANNNFQIK